MSIEFVLMVGVLVCSVFTGLIVEAIKELSSKRPIFSIVAEQLLSVELAQNDSLTFEGLIADLSDEIVLIIESPGTICELGAFSFSNKINKKISF